MSCMTTVCNVHANAHLKICQSDLEILCFDKALKHILHPFVFPF